ncbi:TolC family protein [Thermosyntropha sp.]|uniref:TolC family protein n=1 Tax=Thermosyntropha sp. TaxID=2740820 RepID=UPI0025CFC5F1|nr:TolC family protein [Thermosyntropha sp.]MBO8159062.1 TolC family protein [Thermosyntropha sp.]
MENLKRIVVFFMLVFFMAALVPLPAEAEEVLTIEEALAKAHKSNPDLRRVDLEVEKAQIMRDDAAEAVYYIPTGGLVYPEVQQVVNMYQQAEIQLNALKKQQKAEKARITKEVITAYADAVKKYNEAENLRVALKNAEEKLRISAIMREVGYISSFDYEQTETGIKQLKESYKAALRAYEGSVANLAALLGESQGWKPRLASRAVLAEYPRHELSVEISRGLEESVMVWSKKALYDIEESKQNWILPNEKSEITRIKYEVAGIDYEKAKRDTRAVIENLYYTIDTLEGQIKAAETAYVQAEKAYNMAKIKYEAGIIPRIGTANDDLITAEANMTKAKLDLENLRLDLAKVKAEYAYLTGKEVYNSGDWN